MLKSRHSPVGLLLLLGGPAALYAGDILEHVPRDCSAVIVVRDPRATADRLSALIRRVSGDKNGDPAVQLDEFMNRFSLNTEWWDHRAPLVFIYGGENKLVLGFKRSSPNRFERLGEPNEEGSRVRKLVGRAAAQGFGTRINDYVFLSPDPKSLRQISKLEPGESVAGALADDQKKVYGSADLYAHVRSEPWLPTIRQFVAIAQGFAKFSSATAGSDAEAGFAVIDWGAQGIIDLLGQMRWTDISVSFDDAGTRLTHVHRFERDSAVDKYLRKSRRNEGATFTNVPDGPFLLAVESNWVTPGENAITTQMLERLFQCESVKSKLDADERRKLIKAVNDWHSRLESSCFVMLTTPRTGTPLEIMATYRTPDPDTALTELIRMQKMSCEATAALLPTGGLSGDFSDVIVAGRRVNETRFRCEPGDAKSEAILNLMYGDARLQIAKIDDRTIGYVMTPRKNGIESLFELRRAKSLAHNARLRESLAHLPKDPHIVLVLDVGRAFSLAPAMAIGMEAAGTEKLKALANRESDEDASSIVAWTLSIAPQTVRGDLYYSNADAARLGKIIQSFATAMTQGRPAEAVKDAPRPKAGPAKPKPRKDKP